MKESKRNKTIIISTLFITIVLAITGIVLTKGWEVDGEVEFIYKIERNHLDTSNLDQTYVREPRVAGLAKGGAVMVTSVAQSGGAGGTLYVRVKVYGKARRYFSFATFRMESEFPSSEEEIVDSIDSLLNIGEYGDAALYDRRDIPESEA